MDYLTEAMKALQRGRSQERMTGNRRDSGIAGANQDEPLYEGYFDAAMKNRRADRALSMQQQQFSQQMKFAEKAQKKSNALGWGKLGAQALGYGFESFVKPWAQEKFGAKETPAITQPIGAKDFSMDAGDGEDLGTFNFMDDTTSTLGNWFGDWYGSWDIDVFGGM